MEARGGPRVTSLVPSIEADRYLPWARKACSWESGWRSLLLRTYDQPAVVQEITTPPATDQLIVLITTGVCHIESRSGRTWQGARYRPGTLGMTRPGQETTLRWRGPMRLGALHLHLPRSTMAVVAGELPGGSQDLPDLPNDLAVEDPLIQHLLLSLADAMAAGAPDLYAESSAALLAAHLLIRHGKGRPPVLRPRDDARLRRVEALMRENLGEALTLAAMAEEAGVGRFHLLRLFKQTYGETPLKRLTRLRMEEARRLLHGHGQIIEIAFACGYGNPAHFAAAFRRIVGMTPRAYREMTRGTSRPITSIGTGNSAGLSGNPAGAVRPRPR